MGFATMGSDSRLTVGCTSWNYPWAKCKPWMSRLPYRLQVVFDALDKPRVIKLKGALDLVTETDEASERAVLQVQSGYTSLTLRSHSFLMCHTSQLV